MATTERSPKANSYPSNAIISTLRSNIASNNTVTASDINNLISLINNWLGHYHTYDDAYQLATYGNTGDRNNYYVDKNSSVLGGSVAASNVNAGENIAASTHNAMRNSVATLASHTHSIDDRTS
jgi:hypothetical protein